jgi:hypothetical protein
MTKKGQDKDVDCVCKRCVLELLGVMSKHIAAPRNSLTELNDRAGNRNTNAWSRQLDSASPSAFEPAIEPRFYGWHGQRTASIAGDRVVQGSFLLAIQSASAI